MPRASGVAPDQQLYFTGSTTLPDDSEFEWWRDESSGDGQWSGNSQAIPFLDNFDIREVLFDSSDRLLFAGTMTAFGTETVAAGLRGAVRELQRRRERHSRHGLFRRRLGVFRRRARTVTRRTAG